MNGRIVSFRVNYGFIEILDEIAQSRKRKSYEICLSFQVYQQL